jgi:hypothetical protein
MGLLLLGPWPSFIGTSARSLEFPATGPWRLEGLATVPFLMKARGERFQDALQKIAERAPFESLPAAAGSALIWSNIGLFRR